MRHIGARGSIAAIVLLASQSAWAQAIVHPNQLNIDIRFTNTNPEIVAALNQAVAYHWGLKAESVGLTPVLSHRTSFDAPSRLTAASQLSVESSAAGIAYDLVAQGGANNGRKTYYTAPVRSMPLLEEPAPDADVAIRECAGIVRVHWFDNAGNPVAVTGGWIAAYREDPGGPVHWETQAYDLIDSGATVSDLLVRGDGVVRKIIVHFTWGTDPYSDLISYEVSGDLAVGCDEIVDVAATGNFNGMPCLGDSSSLFALGRIVGDVDVLGEDENPEVANLWNERTFVRADTGPWGNYRNDRIPTSPASGAFELENLVPSSVTTPETDYLVHASVSLRSGSRLEDIELPPIAVNVGVGETVDVGDALVIDPGFARGDLLFVGPPPSPGIVTPLDTMRRLGDPGTDLDNDGVHESTELSRWSCMDSWMAWAPASSGPGWTFNGNGGHLSAAFAGSFDPAIAAFTGDYELVVGSPGPGPSVLALGRYHLVLESTATPAVPLSYLYTQLYVSDNAAGRTRIAPGEVLDHPVHACYGQVMVDFFSTGAPFRSPRLATVIGGQDLVGVDFEGRPMDLNVHGSGSGTPTYTQAASTRGQVVTFLPEGDYTLVPSANVVNPGGGTSTTEFTPIQLHVGCRESITLAQDFILDLSSLPPCTQAGRMTVTGAVRGASPVSLITYTVNGGAPITWCTNCGVEPRFSIDLNLVNTDNTIMVTAESADGRRSTRSCFSRYAPEPSSGRGMAWTPLTVRKSSGRIAVAWETLPGLDASVYRGTIASLRTRRTYDHAGFGACNIAGGQTTVDPGTGSFYYLVGSPCAWGDSSLGRDYFGRERPPALNRCR